jgi:hypothetical protein
LGSGAYQADNGNPVTKPYNYADNVPGLDAATEKKQVILVGVSRLQSESILTMQLTAQRNASCKRVLRGSSTNQNVVVVGRRVSNVNCNGTTDVAPFL